MASPLSIAKSSAIPNECRGQPQVLLIGVWMRGKSPLHRRVLGLETRGVYVVRLSGVGMSTRVYDIHCALLFENNDKQRTMLHQGSALSKPSHHSPNRESWQGASSHLPLPSLQASTLRQCHRSGCCPLSRAGPVSTLPSRIPCPSQEKALSRCTKHVAVAHEWTNSRSRIDAYLSAIALLQRGNRM